MLFSKWSLYLGFVVSGIVFIIGGLLLLGIVSVDDASSDGGTNRLIGGILVIYGLYRSWISYYRWKRYQKQ